jgi:hypothetical protein
MNNIQLGKKGVAVVVLTLSLSACDGLLDVEIPGQLAAEDITKPSLIGIMINSVQADFECAYSNYAAFVGLFTDEWMSASSFGPGPEAVDKGEQVVAERGNVDCEESFMSSTSGHYLPLHVARVQGESVFEIISNHDDALVPNKSSVLATIQAYTGYALTALGESFCTMALDEGPLMQPDAVLALAEGKFTSAITLAGGDADIVNWATLGRARVRLTLGKTAEALTDAMSIPAGFVKNVTRGTSPARVVNTHWSGNTNGRFWTLDVSYLTGSVTGGLFRATGGLMVSGVNGVTGLPETMVDTRLVGVDEEVFGHDAQSPLWSTTKYANADDPIPLATWEEAQLIMAEVQGGQDAVDAINRLRDAAPGGPLPHFVSTVAAEIRAEWLEERRRILFGQGSRLADILRYPEFDLPSGLRPYKPVNSYNELYTCLPLPQEEIDGNANLG